MADRRGGDPMADLQIKDSGGEISMSIDETNKLRISLGLKPLNMEAPQKQSAVDVKKQEEARKQAEQEKQAADLRARIAAHRNARQQESFLAVKSLGAADDGDDAASWVERSRQAEVQRKREQQTAARQLDEDEDDQVGRSGYASKDLAGLKIRHLGAHDISGGDEVILTLADRGILDEKGNLDEDDDELENVRMAEERKRKKAREMAAPKAKPLWEEDGKRRGILDKYDEEDEQILCLDDQGGMAANEEQQRREETRRKLEQAGKMLESASGGGPSLSISRDYLTAEEVKKGAVEKKKKRKERKMRNKTAEDEAPESTEDLISQLEAQQAVGGEDVGGDKALVGGDLGGRGDRATARERIAAAELAAATEKRARFSAALEKSNWASQALKPLAPKSKPEPGSVEAAAAAVAAHEGVSGMDIDEEAGIGEDAADLELQLSLERARRMAAATKASAATPDDGAVDEESGLRRQGMGTSLAGLAASAAVKREEEEKRIKEEIKSGALSGHVVFNDSLDFVSTITLKKEEEPSAMALDAPVPAPDIKGEDDDRVAYMGVGDEGEIKEKRKKRGSSKKGGWTNEDGEEEEEEEEAPTAGRKRGGNHQRPRPQADEDGSASLADESVATQSQVGKGLVGVLGLLKDKGQLGERQVWAGRNSDKSKVALIGLEDVYTGGASEERVARSVEAALTRKDEFGRILTPKERFRELCYQFHGKGPSKNKVEKKLRQAKEEIAIRRAAASEEGAAEAEKLLKVQERTAQPFLVLSGKGVKDTIAAARGSKGVMLPPPSRPPSSKKQKSGSGTQGGVSRPVSLGGVLGGGLTPLMGDRKVEAMLGVTSTNPLAKSRP